jgi:hypothetical protein
MVISKFILKGIFIAAAIFMIVWAHRAPTVDKVEFVLLYITAIWNLILSYYVNDDIVLNK